MIVVYFAAGMGLLAVASLVMWWFHEGLTRELIIVAAIVIVLPILTVFALLALHGWRL